MEELLQELWNAATLAERESCYMKLERIGIDRVTANILAKELQENEKNE